MNPKIYAPISVYCGEISPQQALEDYEGGLSYTQIAEKYGISESCVRSRVLYGKRGREAGVPPKEASVPPVEASIPLITVSSPKAESLSVESTPTDTDMVEGVIKSSDSSPSSPGEEFYEVVKPIPFHPISGGGPFKVGDVLCAGSFPNKKYSAWRLRNLLIEGRLVRI